MASRIPTIAVDPQSSTARPSRRAFLQVGMTDVVRMSFLIPENKYPVNLRRQDDMEVAPIAQQTVW